MISLADFLVKYNISSSNNVFLASDTHFNHDNILKFEPYRGDKYVFIDDMNSQFIMEWNDTVNDNDVVIFMGDFALGDEEKAVKIMNALRGKKIIIRGNHDTRKKVNLYNSDLCPSVVEVHDIGMIIHAYSVEFHFSHYPMELGCNKSRFNIHGHIHSKSSPSKDQINVGVDSDYMAGRLLVPLSTVISDARLKIKKYREETKLWD
ncbi:phosphoesterase [Listeria phage WIL-1]|uniref:phosphoesterase n=1 Tax=Listeria phage WIL-1 TaxID=1541821 RepID=UPI00248B1608|nr:phosphoesterase [Listeria phage WIL-1]